MIRLSVNINKIATIRNARGGNNPNILQVAKDCERFGANGITVHPRPDERHIRKTDVYDLAKIITTEFNIEGYPTPDFIDLVSEVKPHQVTLVPDPPHALTSNSGWDTIGQNQFLKKVVGGLKSQGIRVSLFLNPQKELVTPAIDTGTDCIELYTGYYAENYSVDKKLAILPYLETARFAFENGLKINAGHDLSLENLAYFAKNIPFISEVSIGHALICDALYYGLDNTINMYQQKLSILE